ALSSRTGATVWQVAGGPQAIAAVGDVDHDGVRDVALGLAGFGGQVEVRSGRSGLLLYRFDGGPFASSQLPVGNTLAALPDLDGDGVDDLLVGAPQPYGFSSFAPGRVFVVSAATGKILCALRGEHTGQQFGAALACLGDVDHDGRIEIA